MEITWLGHSCFKLKSKNGTVITDPFEGEAQACSTKDPDCPQEHRNGKDKTHYREPQGGDAGKPEGNRKQLSTAHGGDTGPFPRPKDEPESDSLGHKVKSQAAEDFIDTPFNLEQSCDDSPKASAQHAPKKGHDKYCPGYSRVSTQSKNGCGSDGACHHLALYAYIPEANSKAENKPASAQGERYPPHKDLRDFQP